MAIAGKVAIVPKGEWDNTTSYEKLDVVSYNNGTYIAKKASIGVIPVDGDTWMLAVKSIDAIEFEKIINGTTVVGKAANAATANTLNPETADLEDIKTTFTETATRENINSKETASTLFGKIKKWFSDLKSVAFSGSYNDLSDKPTIPSVGNGTITVTQNGTTMGTFTTNQSGNTTITLTDNDTTYSDATTSSSGLMSPSDKIKLNGIASGANAYTLPSATSSTLGGVKTTDSSAVTDSTGLALPATEKNASISGTLANQISTLNNNLSKEVFLTSTQSNQYIDVNLDLSLYRSIRFEIANVTSGYNFILNNVTIDTERFMRDCNSETSFLGCYAYTTAPIVGRAYYKGNNVTSFYVSTSGFEIKMYGIK